MPGSEVSPDPPGAPALASQVAPHQRLRTLDALHLATWLLARLRLDEDKVDLAHDGRAAGACVAILLQLSYSAIIMSAAMNR